MEKQDLKFFILHTLAQRLQHWADFLFKQVGVGGEFIAPSWLPQNQANAESANTEHIAVAPHIVPAPDMGSASADNPPAHWLEQTRSDAPPTHWLARVQKD